MFSAGRYDPNRELDNRKKRKIEEEINVTNNSSKESLPNVTIEDDSDSSSSCPPTSDDSSSSAPSSDSDESDEEDGSELAGPAFQVIAPEQKILSVDIMKKRLDTTNEGIDDFDHDNEKQSIEHSDEIKRALRMSKLGIKEAAKIWNLAPFLVQNLERDKYTSFFPIQALVIPDVIASERHAHIRNRDVTVSSPTGSGKTLAFVIPVLNSLAKRKIRRLRALAVLPSRDLATQVYDVFERYAQGSDLKIGLAIGQTDFEAEQRKLTFGSYQPFSNNYHTMQHALKPFSINNAMKAFGDSDINNSASTGCIWAETNLKRVPGFSIPNGGTSSIDILVCTPGRLMDHLDKTPGFTLQHLRFLVIDEADRLMNQSYQNWVERVVNAASAGPEHIRSDFREAKDIDRRSSLSQFDPVTWRREERKVDQQSTISFEFNSFIDVSVCRPVQLRKFLFSATLTKDPKKLTSLGLVNPKQFDAHQFSIMNLGRDSNMSNPKDILGYSLPEGLSESMVECSAQQKPLVLLAAILEQGELDKNIGLLDGIVVVFTSSKDSTHRLTRLLQLLWVAAGYGPATCIGEFSSALNQKQRANLIKRCNENMSDERSRVQVIVCSDGMSRGMDIQSVSAVVNYDVPSYAKTYVHRCGRTARAGRKGRAITILKGGQITKFLKMRNLIGNPDRVETMGIKKDLVKTAIPVYQNCIKALENVMNAEANDDLPMNENLGPEWLISELS